MIRFLQKRFKFILFEIPNQNTTIIITLNSLGHLVTFKKINLSGLK
jgi:hypothetical protein